MSAENVEIVRGYLEAYDRRSPEEVAEWVEKYWDPDGNLYTARKLPESRPQHGREEISRYAADWRRPGTDSNPRSGASSPSATIAS